MTKPVKLVVGTLVALLAISGFWVLTKPKTGDKITISPTAAPEPQTNSNGSPATPADSGKYVDYNESLLKETTGTRLLFFHAPWCPQCRQLEASIQAGGIPEGVTIFKVDYDTNQKLRQKYGVTIQTSIVMLGESTESGKKFVAYDDPTLASVKANLLQ